jgi:aminoglycoside phosphotransferase (APT) family kinase protein
VLDWEVAEPRGLPLVDLLYFLADLGCMLDDVYAHGDVAAAYRASLDPHTLTGSVRQACIERYVRALGLEAAEVRALRLLAWLRHAIWEMQEGAAVRRNRFLLLWQEDLRALAQAG